MAATAETPLVEPSHLPLPRTVPTVNTKGAGGRRPNTRLGPVKQTRHRPSSLLVTSAGVAALEMSLFISSLELDVQHSERRPSQSRLENLSDVHRSDVLRTLSWGQSDGYQPEDAFEIRYNEGWSISLDV